MTAEEEPAAPPHLRFPLAVALRRAGRSPRLLVYLSCTLIALLTSYHLGKDMLWDTMDYHVYAGFSALHDRFARDYFAAAPQGYFNPYAYVPFYLLLRTPLAPLAIASILAVLQSAILWLTYELAMRVVPGGTSTVRVWGAILATVLAFANPVLINQFGSSFADVTTAEIALAGWLVLLGAVAAPGGLRVALAALLLGAASGLKPTNAVHAVAAAALLLFIPVGWPRRLRFALWYGVALFAGFVLVSVPWAVYLEHEFGNPVFPLLNGLFRSPQYLTGSMLDHRFIPVSLGAALLRPFAMVVPAPMVHFETAAPDLRYALLLVLAALLLLLRLRRGARAPRAAVEEAGNNRMLIALGCAFVLDWVLWLTASGNSRYFIPMACVAAVLDIALIQRLCTTRPRLRHYLLAAIFAVQFFQLYSGAEYRDYLPWRRRPWYSVQVPAALASAPDLYFMIGGLSNSFIIPDMPRRAGFINLDGMYQLGAGGANGRHIEAMIRRHGRHLRALWSGGTRDPGHRIAPYSLERADDALAPFGLQVDAGRCATLVVHGIDPRMVAIVRQAGAHAAVPNAVEREYLVTCHVRHDASAATRRIFGQRAANRAFDHLEDACPALFQPARPHDVLLGDHRRNYVFIRTYTGSGVQAWISAGAVHFQKLIGGREEDAGTERLWDTSRPQVRCSAGGSGSLQVLRP